MSRILGTPNIQHPTPNIQWRASLKLFENSMLDVECWMLNVEFNFTIGGPQ
jgi:hypothetical protein